MIAFDADRMDDDAAAALGQMLFFESSTHSSSGGFLQLHNFSDTPWRRRFGIRRCRRIPGTVFLSPGTHVDANLSALLELGVHDRTARIRVRQPVRYSEALSSYGRVTLLSMSQR